MSTESNVTFTITTTFSKPDASIPWYLDTIANTSIDHQQLTNLSSIVSAVPGVISHSHNRNASPTTQETVLQFNPNLIGNISAIDSILPDPGNLTGTAIFQYIESTVNSQNNNENFSSLLANLASYASAHSCTSSTQSTMTPV